MWDRSGRRFERMTYAELLELTRSYCARWRAAGVQEKDRLLICLGTSLDFVGAWLGAICAGAYPAAIAPAVGGLKGSNHFAAKLETFRNVIGASRLLISEQMVGDLRKAHPDTLGAIALSLGELQQGSSENGTFANANPTELAFMQFTSGSTGTPRAVMINHRMATSNAYNINEGIYVKSGRPVGDYPIVNNSWLPMHHDMGLIGCLIFAIGCGLELSLMNPTTFLARPLRYLEAAHGREALISGPNFGFQFCVDRLTPDDVQGLDFTRVESAMTGSEMIRPETMSAFCELMTGTGFRPENMAPCYGMAEATLAVTFDRKRKGIRTRPVPKTSEFVFEDQEVVCVGEPVPDTEVIIANAAGEVMMEGELGEVQVKGSSVFDGYYNDGAASAESLRGEWLKTGDIGFVYDGELYIAGRSKEILVIRGDNVMPHEIEWLAEEARGESQSAERVAAFSVTTEGVGEEIALVVETTLTDPPALKELDHAIRSRIGRGLSYPVADLVFVRRGRIPRTSSGKVQRGAVKEQYLNGAIDRLEF